ncbi:hypothetical protein SAMN05192584_110143 [Streptomyces pini]|uniref:Uncharacterized protein n=1 Tax=Streptomyces pini TaxID=1520580 RepID=A0A1I4DIQ3_9ACTN|nr:hypothetical protein SAMN05192584_110143 [Streptomyces pini]
MPPVTPGTRSHDPRPGHDRPDPYDPYDPRSEGVPYVPEARHVPAAHSGSPPP